MKNKNLHRTKIQLYRTVDFTNSLHECNISYHIWKKNTIYRSEKYEEFENHARDENIKELLMKKATSVVLASIFLLYVLILEYHFLTLSPP